MRSRKDDNRPATIDGDAWARLAWEIGRAVPWGTYIPDMDGPPFREFLAGLTHPDAKWLTEQLGAEYAIKYLRMGQRSRGIAREPAQQLAFDVD